MKAPREDDSPGLSDQLNYGILIADGVILCKDGSFLAGWAVEGEDSGSWSKSQRTHQSDVINGAFSRLGDGWSNWYDIFAMKSHEYDTGQSEFQDEVTALIDEERREIFAGDDVLTLDRRQVLILQYTPDSKVYRKAAALFFEDNDEDRRSPAATLVQELATVRARLSEFESSMRSVVKLTRMLDYDYDDEPGIKYSNLVNYIDFRVSGKSREVAIVGDAIYLDGIFAYDYFDPAYPVKIGNDYVLAVCIDGFPPVGHPGILDGLARLKCEYVWSTRSIFRGRVAALSEIGTYEKSWRMQVHGLLAHVLRKTDGKEDLAAKEMQEDALDAEHRVSSGRTVSCFYTSVLIFRGPDLKYLQECVKMATETGALASAKFNMRHETWNAVEAIIGSWPGHTVHNVRRPMLNARNFADLVCWSTLWRGPEEHPNRLYPEGSGPLMYAFTKDGSPFRFVPFDGDLGNIIAYGPSGSGKTALLNAMASQEARYPWMREWAWDFKYGLYTLAKHCGWQHYDLGQPGALSLCPLGNLDDDEEVQYAKTWIEQRFISRVNRKPSGKQSKAINATIKMQRDLPDMRSLSDFCAFVQDPEVRDVMRHFTVDGAGGSLLDAREDVLDSDVNVVFECEEFVHNVDESILSATYSFLFRKFLRGLRVDRPSSMYMDEAHYGLRDKHFAPMLDIAYRTIRSKNGRITLATQSIKEAVENGLGPLLNESCGMHIYLPNSKAGDSGSDAKYPGPRDYYYMMGRTDEDIEIIRTAKKKQDYYVVTADGKQLIDLGISDTLLEIIETPVIREEIRDAVDA